jgi:hypothetical protein
MRRIVTAVSLILMLRRRSTTPARSLASWMIAEPTTAARARPPRPSPGSALPLTYFGEFGNKAKKRPILKGFLNKGETSSLIGPPKSLKSGLMTEIAIRCAAGQDWRGHSATERCGVAIFALDLDIPPFLRRQS